MKLSKMFYILLLMIGISYSGSAFCGQYSGKFHILELHLEYNLSAWYVWIKPDIAVVNPDGCDKTDYYALPMNYPYASERYATLLAAFSEQKLVQVYISGCVLTAPSDWPKVDQSRLTVSD